MVTVVEVNHVHKITNNIITSFMFTTGIMPDYMATKNLSQQKLDRGPVWIISN